MISAVIQYDDNRVSIHTSKTKEVGEKFTKGFYQASYDQNGNLVIKREFLKEIHDPFESEETSNILSTTKAFFEEGIREKVNGLGFIHKLGILLHGKPGNGKTSLMNFIADWMVSEKDAIVFFCNTPDTLSAGVSLANSIREIQDNPIIFIADEFERYAEREESLMKRFLDGEISVENSLMLAATNYIDKVPDSLKNRPSRFRIVQEILGIKDKDTMREVLKNMSIKIQPNLLSIKEIEDLIKDKSNVTLDELKHMALDKVSNNYIKGIKTTPNIGFKKEDKPQKNKLKLINQPASTIKSSGGVWVYDEPVKWSDKPEENKTKKSNI